MKQLLIITMLLVALVSAHARGFMMGVGSGGGGGPLTPCGALQLDFSDATGCNAVGIPLIHL